MNEPKFVRRVPRPPAWQAAVLGLSCLGCDPGTGTVSGSVTYHGKAVTYGTVLVVGSNGLPRYGNLDRDGSFVVKGVCTGPARVAVNSPDPAGVDKVPSRPEQLANLLPKDLRKQGWPDQSSVAPPGSAGERQSWFAIPRRYGNPDTSGLTIQVKKGTNALNLGLE